MKTLWVAVAVAVIGMALHGHIHGEGEGKNQSLPHERDAMANAKTTDQKIPFELTLSARAKRVVIRQGELFIEQIINAEIPEISQLRGELNDNTEAIFLEVDWLDQQAPRYFAKLRLDPPGKDGMVHVFESSGDMDDLWELP